ncbi:Prefoldin subunit-domain-containing protein [Cantharellus anzutake]|uniref:Prefoldin subunit-domain-containing protein n=1 Tax=Cantharellus anzutake TaxID=1750568 RepID=UPI001905F870|nr:Prefoldin subunit-domain-containing protein [Cantharellus anzutake]KAF8332003.1 Prefoldin subunit-domain-containing protein [Cantharellus anzutake]
MSSSLPLDSKSSPPQVGVNLRALETNPRGIPKAPFISSVEDHIGGPDAEVESTLKQFQEAIAKYRYMELNLQQRKTGLLEKIPDISKTLSMVKFLRDRRVSSKAGANLEDGLDDGDDDDTSKPLRTTFELNDTLYAEAELENTDQIYLWLGANVMLSYTQNDAIELLTSKLQAAQQNLKNTTEDLEFLREQVTIMEVNTARVYNWDVKRRRERREAARSTGKVDAED